MNTKKYLSAEWKFVEPLSIRSKAQLIQFKNSCKELENFFIEKQITLNKFNFYGTDYNSFLSLELKYEDFDNLKKNKSEFYEFLDKNLPVNCGKEDWLDHFHIHESLSSFHKSNSRMTTHLLLVLNYRQLEVEFPSHDFICMSEDLNNTKDLQKAA